MSEYSDLIDYIKQLERRLAKLERIEGSGVTDHGALTGRNDDDHAQYALLAGRSGGQSLIGGTAANDDLTLEGTSNATRTSSYIVMQPTAGSVGVGVSAPVEKLDVAGNVLLSNNQYYKVKDSAGNAIRIAGVTSGNDVFLGAIDNAGGSVYIREDGATILSIVGGNIGLSNSMPGGKMDALQGSATGAVPALILGQNDLSEEFLRLNTTVGAGNPVDTAALGTYYGKVRVSVNGTFKYLPIYNS